MKKLIIFDFDGVLVDSLEILSEFNKWLYPELTDEIWKEMMRGNYYEVLEQHKLERRTITDLEFEQKRNSLYSKKIYCKPATGITEVIQKLAARYQLAINTTSRQEGVLPWLEEQKLAQYFNFVACKEHSTSKVEKFKLIFRELSISSDESYFVTDTIGDLLEATELKIDTICVTWGFHNRLDFMPLHPYRIIDGPAELLAV